MVKIAFVFFAFLLFILPLLLFCFLEKNLLPNILLKNALNWKNSIEGFQLSSLLAVTKNEEGKHQKIKGEEKKGGR